MEGHAMNQQNMMEITGDPIATPQADVFAASAALLIVAFQAVSSRVSVRTRITIQTKPLLVLQTWLPLWR
jgi:hypothetical protein